MQSPNRSSQLLTQRLLSSSGISWTNISSHLDSLEASDEENRNDAPRTYLQRSVASLGPRLAPRELSYADVLMQSAGMPRNRSQNASYHPTFRKKSVCVLDCKFCMTDICQRGMKAILLADTRVELFSTDYITPGRVQLVGNDYTTKNCLCRISDVACLGCGNVVGYHVTQPCDRCLGACNNGHFWMFHSNKVSATERYDLKGQIMSWATIPEAQKEELKLAR